MKPNHCRPRQPCRRRGMALVIVLSAMALLMVLVVAMLVTGRSETRSAAAFSKSMEVRSLSDLPVNLVMGQIRKATSDLGAARTWASQPGMIRVFSTDSGKHGRGKLESAWKLYSADEMVTDSEFDAGKELESIQTWKASPALFTDLNEPVAVPAEGGTMRRVYPILDPGALGKIEGVSIADGMTAPGATAEQPVPMPVRWLYVLQDGRIVLPTGGTGSKLTFDEEVVTQENPIVGRIAFWTDDESCKVNINTASEGTPWDVPRATGWTDRNYGDKVPAANEFQRFPGHPATTCLSTILQAFDARYAPQTVSINSNGDVGNASHTTLLRDIYSLLPRTNFGSETSIESSRGGSARVPATLYAGVPIKRERLFATVDELFHNSDRGVNAGLEPEELQIGKFFMTAHSRAPETNLFNRPRLSLWPQLQDTFRRNPMDKLIAFCSTASRKANGEPQEHGFLRKSVWQDIDNPGSSQSTSDDYLLPHNQQTFAYLQDLTSRDIPGFAGAKFSDKYDTQNRYQILLSMFDLQRWGVNSWYSFADPTKKLIDTAKSYFFTPPGNTARFDKKINPSLTGEGAALPAIATATPAGPQPSGAIKAFGRFPTIGEVAVVFMAASVEQAPDSTGVNQPVDKVNNFTYTEGPDGWADNTKAMRAYIILQPYTPVVGIPGYSPNVRYVIEGLDQWTADNVTLSFPKEVSKTINRSWVSGGASSEEYGHISAYTGLSSQFLRVANNSSDTSSVKSAVPGNEMTGFPFISDKNVTMVDGKSEFEFSGGTLTIKVYSGFGPTPDPTTTPPIQSIQVHFPSARLRVPRLGKDSTGWLTTLMTPSQRLSRIKRHLNSPFAENGRQVIVGWGDTVRSMSLKPEEYSRGDYRILAAHSAVPQEYFSGHPSYADTATEQLQSLRWAGAGGPAAGDRGHYGTTGGARHQGRQESSAVSGTLLAGVSYWEDCQPAVPRGLAGASKIDGRPGDWDNGPGRLEDGPYISKPDAGGLDTGGGTSLWTDQGGGYFERHGTNNEEGRGWSPNRQICSAVAFGSLPTGVHPVSSPRPWQTLLFCPNPPSRTTSAADEPGEDDHYGFKSPRDHLLMDLFWMPVVEPYAISEPFSTGGKVNMNHQMLPFSFIQRATGLHAVLHSVRVNAYPSILASAGGSGVVDPTDAQKEECYKSWDKWLKYETAYEINAAETVKGMQTRFAQGDLYRSASEICDIYLVPRYMAGKGSSDYAPGINSPPGTYDQMTNWWNGDLGTQTDGFELTGDNTRESPYNQIYPRLTTRSNVYQVHYRVQVIRKTRSSAVAEWDEAHEKPAAELRGSSLFERYLDPNDPELPNFLANPDTAGALDDFYRFRIIRQKQFAP